MVSKVLCPGSFDPITLGHIDIIQRARHMFGEVLVAVGNNTNKKYLFDLTQRVSLVEKSVSEIPGIKVMGFDGLLVDFAAKHGINTVVKGLRFGADFDFELQMAHMNKSLSGLETVLLPASVKHVTLSSTILREIAIYGGDVSEYVTEPVWQAITQLKKK